MKTLKILFAAFLFTCFVGINYAQAQAEVIKDLTFPIEIGGETVMSYASHVTMTPSGNMMMTAKFQFSSDNPALPEKGVLKLEFGEADLLVFADGSAILTYKIKWK